MALVVGGSHKTTSRCSECGAEMEYRGRARTEIRGIEAPFDVYLCGRCLAVQLVSIGDGRIYRKFASKFVSRGTIKLCVSCGSRIPLASEECQFCGSKQPSWEELKRKRSRDLEMMVGGRSFVKACIGCGSRIPIASEECEFCGSRQTSWRELQRTAQQTRQAPLKRVNQSMNRRASLELEKTSPGGGQRVSVLRSEANPQAEIQVKIGECMVCRRMVKNREDVISCPFCGNIAHKAHMLEWLHVKDTCPVCKQRIANP